VSDKIDYGNLMHRAMRGLIQEVLTGIAKDGLPSEHHFFITFDTMHPDVEIADWLSDRYPGEMTVVIQHWFDNLNVTDEGFTITLNLAIIQKRSTFPTIQLRRLLIRLSNSVCALRANQRLR